MRITESTGGRPHKKQDVLGLFAFIILCLAVSAGGGAFCVQKIHTLIKKNFISVWLDVNEKTIFYRLRRNQAKRPLLKGMDERELRRRIKNLMIERNDCYSKADIKVKLSDQTISESINKTYSKIINYFSKDC